MDDRYDEGRQDVFFAINYPNIQFVDKWWANKNMCLFFSYHIFFEGREDSQFDFRICSAKNTNYSNSNEVIKLLTLIHLHV